MELDDAIGRISEIRTQLARTETFRGFRALTVAFSGALGVAAAVVQASCIPQPVERLGDYLRLWIGAALVNLIVIGVELAYGWSITDSPLKRRLTIQAIQQFAPCVLAGAVMTGVIAASAPEIAWVLPGLWAMLFSLGVFACCRLLPGPMHWLGAYYMVSGAVCLAFGRGEFSLSPWLMVGTFAAGQLLAAGILASAMDQSHE